MMMQLILALVALGLFAMMASPSLHDATLKILRALPASTSAVTSAAAIDMGPKTQLASTTRTVELLLTAPAVSTSQLPDGKTFIYDIIHSDNADLSSPGTLHAGIITQIGAAGAGAATATARRRLPSDAKQYIGMRITPSASGTGDASAATAILELLA